MFGHENLNSQQLKNKPKKGKRFIDWKMVLIVGVIVVYLGAQIVTSLKDAIPVEGVVGYNELIEMIKEGKVNKVSVIRGNPVVTIELKDGTFVESVNPQSDKYVEDLMKAGANISYSKSTFSESIIGMLLALPVVVMLSMFTVYITRTIAGASTRMFTILHYRDNHTKFDDIRGISETKNEVMFLIQRLKDWKMLGELGARPVKGVLFYGPPGTGKTMLAKAIANEAGVPFISASGSDFNEVFVGTGARRVRDLWDLAVSNAPCILFIDEIDCIGKRRRGDGAAMENNQTINALLQRMDGLNHFPGVLVIGATNDKTQLDEALLRSGRFDREFFVGPPTSKSDRDQVVDLYLGNKKLDPEVTLDKASKLLCGLTAADIEEALSEAVYVSLMDGRNGVIKLRDIDEASMKIHLSGVKREHSSEWDEQVTAIHEAGHTLVSLLVDIPVLKVSIIAYSSGAGGITVRDNDELGDIKLKLFNDLKKDIMILLAGKCAEDLQYGTHTQGCMNDIEVATNEVYSICTCMGENNDSLMNQNVLISRGYTRSIDKEVLDRCNQLMSSINTEVMDLLRANNDRLQALYGKLLEEKTIVAPTLQSIDSIQEGGAHE